MRQHTWKTEDAEFVASQSEGESVIEFKETGKTFWENECSFEIGSCVDELIHLSSALTASEERVKKLEAVLKNIEAAIDAPHFNTARKYAIRDAASTALEVE